MREYEAMFILQPEMDDDGVNGFVEKLGGIVGENDGEVILAGQLADKRGGVNETTEGWKKRRLAYPLKNLREGYYVVLRFSGSSELLEKLDYAVRYDDDVVRHLVLRTDED